MYIYMHMTRYMRKYQSMKDQTEMHVNINIYFGSAVGFFFLYKLLLMIKFEALSSFSKIGLSDSQPPARNSTLFVEMHRTGFRCHSCILTVYLQWLLKMKEYLDFLHTFLLLALHMYISLSTPTILEVPQCITIYSTCMSGVPMSKNCCMGCSLFPLPWDFWCFVFVWFFLLLVFNNMAEYRSNCEVAHEPNYR